MKRLACASIVLLLAAALTPGLIARAEEKAAAALSNAEVVKLCKAGLGDGVVIGKINQAPETAFKMETDDIIKLKQDGCSQAVIEAMLNRSTAPAAASHSDDSGGSGGSASVKLVTSTGEVALTPEKGKQQQVVAFGVHNFCQYKTFSADTRTTEKKVSVLVSTSGSLEDRIWLVAVEQDDDDKDRSVPLVSASPWGGRVADEPDDDAIVDCVVKEEKPGTWRLTPKKDLKPGEYGVYIVGGVLHDFGVDK